jgi:ATP-dependent DNA helicase RecG
MPTSMPITLPELATTTVSRLRGVTDERAAALAAFGVENVLDLLTVYPRRHIDRSNLVRLADLEDGMEALVLVTVQSVSSKLTKQRRSMVTVQVGDGSGGRLSVVFFNQPWRERQLRVGVEVALFGRVEAQRGLTMMNPVVDLIGDRMGRIVPVYPQSEKTKITSWSIAGLTGNALEKCSARGLMDPVPPAILRQYDLIGRDEAFRAIHFPESAEQQAAARRRLAFDELFRVQMVLVTRKRALERRSTGIRHNTEGDLVARFHAALPFPLTGDQRSVIAEIETDLSSHQPMHRLLQGDVGAGKTLWPCRHSSWPSRAVIRVR